MTFQAGELFSLQGRTALLTGASGFLGHAVCAELRKRDHEVAETNLREAEEQLAAVEGVGFVVVRAEIDYKIGARLDDLLTVTVAPLETKRAYFWLEQEARLADGRQFTGKVVGTYQTADLTEDEVLAMIIGGKPAARVEQVHRLPHAT